MSYINPVCHGCYVLGTTCSQCGEDPKIKIAGNQMKLFKEHKEFLVAEIEKRDAEIKALKASLGTYRKRLDEIECPQCERSELEHIDRCECERTLNV